MLPGLLLEVLWTVLHVGRKVTVRANINLRSGRLEQVVAGRKFLIKARLPIEVMSKQSADKSNDSAG